MHKYTNNLGYMINEQKFHCKTNVPLENTNRYTVYLWYGHFMERVDN